jgi:hypothetical protein
VDADNRNGGYTLREIVILFSIIAVLVSTFFAIMSGKQAGWRDATRLEDVKIIEDALYKYFARHREFPICPQSPIEACLQILQDEGFLTVLPRDPSMRSNTSRARCQDAAAYLYCYESLSGRDYGVTYNLETDAVGLKGWSQSGPAAKH